MLMHSKIIKINQSSSVRLNQMFWQVTTCQSYYGSAVKQIFMQFIHFFPPFRHYPHHLHRPADHLWQGPYPSPTHTIGMFLRIHSNRPSHPYWCPSCDTCPEAAPWCHVPASGGVANHRPHRIPPRISVRNYPYPGFGKSFLSYSYSYIEILLWIEFHIVHFSIKFEYKK